MAELRRPQPGDILHLTEAASVQFLAGPILFRVGGVRTRTALPGWVWVDGWELDRATGLGVRTRTLPLWVAGIEWAAEPNKVSD